MRSKVDRWCGVAIAAVVSCAATAVVMAAPGRPPIAPPACLVMSLGAAVVAAVALTRMGNQLAIHNAHQQRTKRAELRNLQLLDTAHEGIWVVDAALGTVFANRRLAHMFGLTQRALNGRPLSAFLGENERADLDTVLSSDPHLVGSARDLCYRRADGGVGWAIVSGRPVGPDQGLPEGVLLLLTDITERKKSELAVAGMKTDLEVRIRMRTVDLTRSNEQLREQIRVREAAEQALADSERRLNEIVDALPVPLFLKDAEGRVILMNAACEQMWGTSEALCRGTRVALAMPAAQARALEADDRAAFTSRRLMVREVTLHDRQRGERRRCQSYKKPVFMADGQAQYLICMLVDLEERKRAEEALARSLSQLRQLTAHLESIRESERKRIALDIHDELGQNLMALKIDASLLHTRTLHSHPRLNRKAACALQTIDATIRSVRAIINDLHPSTLELGLGAALEWLLGEYRQRSALDTSLTITGGDGAHLDKRITAAVFRAVQESLANVVRHAQARTVAVRLRLAPALVAVTVQDDGIGMDTDSVPGDAHFGLRGMRERVCALGGAFAVESRRGHGTSVSITIPLQEEEEADHELIVAE